MIIKKFKRFKSIYEKNDEGDFNFEDELDKVDAGDDEEVFR